MIKCFPWIIIPAVHSCHAVLTGSEFADMSRQKQRRRSAVIILCSAFASFVLSVTLWFTGSHEQGIYVGLWVPSILSFGNIALFVDRDGNE